MKLVKKKKGIQLQIERLKDQETQLHTVDKPFKLAY